MRRVAGESSPGRHETRYGLTSASCCRERSSCWKTSSALGQLPPRRVVRLVARSLESSEGKKGTLDGRLITSAP
jgi:hypothetical protein